MKRKRKFRMSQSGSLWGTLMLMAKQRDGTAPAFPAKPGKAETGCPLAGITWSWACCPNRECGWGAEGVSLSTVFSSFQPHYAFTAPPACPREPRKRNCLDRQMEPSVGPVGMVSALGSRQGQRLRGERVSLPVLMNNPNSTHLSHD